MAEIKSNGFVKYVMSGIILVLVFASFGYTTMIYRDMNLRFDNHMIHLEDKFDSKVDEIVKYLSDMTNRLSKIEGKLGIK